MTANPRNGPTSAAYGARPVSIDIARGRPLSESGHPDRGEPRVSAVGRPLTHEVIADRLSLAHWPRGHQIIVCGLAGGTGRTTVAGLIATVLAELPYAHIWHPIALVETAPLTFDRTQRRWDVEPGDSATEPTLDSVSTRSGAWTLAGLTSRQQRRDFSVVVVDSPAGLPSDLATVGADPRASIVMVTRPDRMNLSDAADALVWMHDRSLVARDRVTVLINHGAGHPDRGSKAAAAALGIRCAAIHSLPVHPTLDPGRVLPSGRDLPIRLRRRLTGLCLDVWSQTQSPPRPTGPTSPYF